MAEFKTDNFIGRKIRSANLGMLTSNLILFTAASLVSFFLIHLLYKDASAPPPLHFSSILFGFILFGYLALLLATGASLCFCNLCITSIKTAFTRLQDISRNDAYKQLCKYGDPSEIASEIDIELNDKDSVQGIGTALITKNWLINITAFNVELAKLNELESFYSREFFAKPVCYCETTLYFVGKTQMTVTTYSFDRFENIIAERAPRARRFVGPPKK